MSLKKTIGHIHKLAQTRGFICLSYEAIGMGRKYRWQCSTCNHIWTTSANSIQQGSGCPGCSGKAKRTVSDFKKLALSKGFKFLSTEAMGVSRKHEWQCKNGHIWQATPDNIRKGTGCPNCNNNISEEKCRFIFESLTKLQFPSDWSILGNLQLDGFCKELMMAFEYQGIQHYQFFAQWHKTEKDFIKQRERDKVKSDLCQQKGIRKINIPYTKSITDESLEQYIRSYLLKLGCDIDGIVEWKDFIGKPAKMDELQQLISPKNIKCISNIYIDSKTPLLFECNICEHKWHTTSCRIKHNKGCPKCNNQLRGTIDKMKKIGQKMSMLLLSDKYINRYSKLKWKCMNCHHVWLAFPNNTVRGVGCPECAKIKRSMTRKHNQELEKQR